MSENKASAGRPIEYDLIELANELIEWSFDPESLNLIGFSRQKRFSVTRLADYAAKNKPFSEALILAKENIAYNRLNAARAKTLPEVFHSRCEGMYDPLYHKYDRDNKTFESQLRKEEEKKPSQILIKVQHDGLGSGLDISATQLSDTANQSIE